MTSQDKKKAIRASVKMMMHFYKQDLISETMFRFFVSNALEQEIELSFYDKVKNDKIFTMEDKLYVNQ